MTINVDFSEAKEKNKKIEPGRYNFRVTDLKPKTTQKGEQTVEFTCEFIQPEYEGKTLFYRAHTSGSYAWRLRMFLETINCPMIKEGEVVKGFDPENVLGKEFTADIAYDPPREDGKTWNFPSIKRIYPLENF